MLDVMLPELIVWVRIPFVTFRPSTAIIEDRRNAVSTSYMMLNAMISSVIAIEFGVREDFGLPYQF